MDPMETEIMKYFQHNTTNALYRILPNGHRQRLTEDGWILVSTYTSPMVLEMRYVKLSKEETVKRILKQ